MNVILLDNDRFAVDFLEEQLLKRSNVTIVGMYQDPLLGKAKILSEEVDIVFMDVNLGTVDGIQLAEQISLSKPDVVYDYLAEQ